jgi:hypothetical protein
MPWDVLTLDTGALRNCRENRMGVRQREWLQNDAAAVMSEGIHEMAKNIPLFRPLNTAVERVAAVRTEVGTPVCVSPFSLYCAAGRRRQTSDVHKIESQFVSVLNLQTTTILFCSKL